MPKLPYAEIFSGYEICVRTLQQQQKCIKNCQLHAVELGNGPVTHTVRIGAVDFR